MFCRHHLIESHGLPARDVTPFCELQQTISSESYVCCVVQACVFSLSLAVSILSEVPGFLGCEGIAKFATITPGSIECCLAEHAASGPVANVSVSKPAYDFDNNITTVTISWMKPHDVIMENPVYGYTTSNGFQVSSYFWRKTDPLSTADSLTAFRQ